MTLTQLTIYGFRALYQQINKTNRFWLFWSYLSRKCYICFSQYMKKFEQQLKEKAHLAKIKNAKKTVQGPTKPHSSRLSSTKGDQAQLLLQLYDNKSYDSIPAYKLLRTTGLQHYTRGFIERGYGINLGKLGLLSQKDKEKLYQDLKILPGHTVKLDNLIQTLSHYAVDKDSNIFEDSDKHSQISKTGSFAGRSNKQSIKRGTKSGRMVIHNNQEDLEYERQLQRVLNQYTPVLQDRKKKTFNDRISEKNSISINDEQKKYSKTRYNPPSSSKALSIPGSEFKKKATTPLDSKATVKRTVNPLPPKNSGLKVEKNSTTGTTPSSTKASENVGSIIKGINYKNQPTDKIIQIDLGLQKIQNLNRSFDGAMMSSTIANIDIEELVYSFSGLVQNRVIAAPEPIILKTNHAKQQVQKIQPIRNLDESIEDEVGAILRESYLHPLYRNQDQNIDQQIQQNLENEQLAESEGENELQDQTNKNQNQFMETKNLGQSSFLGASSYDFGLKNSLDIFNEPNPTQLDYFKPTIDSISNFIKNIVLAAKMERQIPIMAAHYMQKFLEKTKIALTSLNYKRLLVSVLLLASKIWDDESFQSPSFSRTFPEYTTVLLNQMEKEVVKFLDYRLKLDKKEYAQIFFRLRQFAKKNARSCQNKRLNLKKIRELQQGIKQTYKSQFMEKRNSF